MKLLIFSLLVATALSAPQAKQEKQQVFQSSQGPLQVILLPGGAAQSTYTTTSVQGQQAIPAGAQIVYLQAAGLQNGAKQGQVAYLQGAPQGQIAYIQGAAPQGQVAYIQGAAPQGQVAFIQGAAPQGQVAYVQGSQLASQGQIAYSQSAAPAVNQQAQFTYQSAAAPQKSSVSSFTSSQYQSGQSQPSSFHKQSSFTQTQTQYKKPAATPFSYKPAPKPAAFTPAKAPAKTSYKGSPSPGSPGTPGQGGVVGYITIKQSQDDQFDGNFQYDFETDHGIILNAVGTLKNPGSEDEIQVISGSYSYKNPDGTVITTTYTADENGFVAQGEHLPVAPPLPELIAKSIEYARSLPPSEDDQ